MLNYFNGNKYEKTYDKVTTSGTNKLREWKTCLKISSELFDV